MTETDIVERAKACLTLRWADNMDVVWGAKDLMEEMVSEIERLRRPPPLSGEGREEALGEVLRAYEQWEADLILTPKAWMSNLPAFTDELWDRFIEIQAMRNAALKSSSVAQGEGEKGK